MALAPRSSLRCVGVQLIDGFDRPTLSVAVGSTAILAAPIALVVTSAILALFHRRVAASMALAARSADVGIVEQPPARAVITSNPLELAIEEAGATVADGPPITSPQRRNVLVFACAGAAAALCNTVVAYQLVTPGGGTITAVLLFLVLATPVVVGTVQVVTVRQRWIFAAAVGWLAVLATTGWALRGGLGVLDVWWVFAGVPTLVVCFFSARRLRAVGPLVFACVWLLLAGIIGGGLVAAGQAIETLGIHFTDPELARLPILDAGARYLERLGGLSLDERIETIRAAATAPLDVLAVEHPETMSWGFLVRFHALWAAPVVGAAAIVWAFVSWYGRRYRHRRASDQMLALEVVCAIFTLAFVLVFTTVSPWGTAFLAGFVAYRGVLAAGLRFRRPAPAAPRRLLVLRVFRSDRGTQDLVDAIGASWRYLGPIRLITGTDLVEANLEPHEFYDFVSGRLSRQFVRDPEEITRRLADSRFARFPDGLFRVEDFFCHRDTWQATVSRLMADSDAVLMDLRTFSAAKEGCVFELRQLVHAVPLDRVVLLADPTTDLTLLEETLRAAWAALPADSVNAGAPRPTLQVLFVGGAAARAQRRVERQVLQRLVALA